MTILSLLGSVLIITGSLIRLQSYRTLDRFFTYHVTVRKDHRLVTTGPYSVVRHPAYTGTIMNYCGLLCWFGSPGAWLRESVVQVSMIRSAVQEDVIMKGLFGKEWEEWARRVPYRIFPGLY
jgi:protein-S-isoprenylcysteine O-methyltransferase Ste14